ncbi:HalOD1 output domain-containing protein [Natrinema sp. 74]|uniref:HalOD1 output domain-containing protein n=1 Tax=Natrinema sp. 74 TaxID=3384159 RepID=UPI0038D4CCCC
MVTEPPTSMRVVRAVAAEEGIDPAELRPPLHDIVDADALDELFPSTADSSNAARAVEFAYRGKRVCIDSAGTVEIAASAERSPSAASDR